MTDTLQGTGLSASHIGEEHHDALVGSVPVMSVAAEDSDVIAVTIQAKAHGLAVELREQLRYRVRILDANYELAGAAAFTATLGANGSVVTADARPAGIFETDENGRLDLDIEDQGGASGLTVQLEVTPVNRAGSMQVLSLTFD